MGKTPEEPEPNIQYFHLHEIVRKRPGMYMGGTDIHALHHLVYEVVESSPNETMAGRCDHIWITLMPDSQVCISDNSPGIEVAGLQSVMTTISSDVFGPVSGSVYETIVSQPCDIQNTIIEKCIANRGSKRRSRKP